MAKQYRIVKPWFGRKKGELVTFKNDVVPTVVANDVELVEDGSGDEATGDGSNGESTGGDAGDAGDGSGESTGDDSDEGAFAIEAQLNGEPGTEDQLSIAQRAKDKKKGKLITGRR